MKVLTIRTDKPEAELAIFDNDQCVDEKRWLAHRQLAETIHTEINSLVEQAGIRLQDIDGIGCFKGPGSFTGLRIGLTVANAMAAVHKIPVVACAGEDWQQQVVARLKNSENDIIAMPEYGAPATTTSPKK